MAPPREPAPRPPARVIPHPEVRDAFTAYLGMVFFLASWAMMFAGLFFAYGFVRSRLPVWPPLDLPELPRLLPGVNAGVAVAGSAALAVALRRLRAGRRERGARALTIAALLALLFLSLQSVVWTTLWRAGLRPTGGPYPSVFYGLTGFHALHVLVGLFALAYLAVRAHRGAYGAQSHLPVRLWAMYWHFVGVVWLVMYATVYLI